MKRLSKKLIDLFPSQSKRKKKFYKEMEQTPSEKIQDELEPIPMPCPMHEDYDDENEKTDRICAMIDGFELVIN